MGRCTIVGWVVVICCVVGGSICEGGATTRRAGMVVSPGDGVRIDTALTVVLRWGYPVREVNHWPASKVKLVVSQREDLAKPVVEVEMAEDRTEYRMAVVPGGKYYWEVVPFVGAEAKGELGTGVVSFTAGVPRIEAGAGDEVRYRNPRAGAHWTEEKPVEFGESEKLAPWYERKSYLGERLPTFEELKGKLPVPIYDGHPDAIEAYWYCWKTLLGVWYFAPSAEDHQAVANLCGFKNWGSWGSTMVWDTAFIMHFARYGHQAYPFETAFDNCYARQHENGFICRESDSNNREVYSGFPVNPPLFAWTEWESYRVTGDVERLKRVFLPIVKHYEWYMTYQRRENGLYWTNGLQEADDSPRNRLMYYAVSATSYQALAAKCLAGMAKVIGREDMVPFFEGEHEKLGEMVNAKFWDEKHGIYNDLDKEGRFITELSPGVFCKHVHMFWPMIAGIAPPERAAGMVKELKNPASFNRLTGVPSLSADSAGYTGGAKGTGQYWCGAVWPSGMCIVQEGLKECGYGDYERELAEKYFKATVAAYMKEKTIRENLAPDQVQGCGTGEFVGWGGIGPVGNLIEGVIGLEVDTPGRRITWHITQIERHGVMNLKLGGVGVDLVCEGRKSAGEACVIHVKSDGVFTLRVVMGGKEEVIGVGKGEKEYIVGK